MKKTFIFLFVLVLSFSVIGTGNATLIDRGADSLGNHLIYDSDQNITWYDYTNTANTWQNQVNWASGLTVNFGGNSLNGWSLPTTVDDPYGYSYNGTTTQGYNITSSEMGYLYYTELGNKSIYDTNGKIQSGWGLVNKGPFTNLQPYWYCSGPAPAPYTYAAWGFNFGSGGQDFDDKGDNFSALAVHPGDIGATSVPEPATMLLLGLGLMGLAGVRRKIKK